MIAQPHNITEVGTATNEASQCAEYGEHIWMKNSDGSEECPCGISYLPPGHPDRDYQ